MGGCTQRPLVIQAVGRGVLAGCLRAADGQFLRPRRRLHGHDEQLSAVLESRNDAAEVRCARRLRLRGRTAAVVLGRRRRHRRHHALRHRPVRHRKRVGDGVRQGHLQQGRLPRRLLHQHPQGRSRSAADRRPQRRADHVRLRHDTIDFDVANVQRSASGTSSATAATCASTTRRCRSPPTPTTAPSSAAMVRTRSSCPSSSAGSSACARIASTTSTTSCSRRGRRS